METFFIETDRLKLYTPHPRFGDQVNDLITDTFDSLHEWMNFAHHLPTIEKTNEMLTNLYDDFVAKEQFHVIIYLKSESKIIGMCKTDDKHPPMTFDGKTPYDVGYWLHKDYVGNGYATEAVKALMIYVHELMKVNLFSIHCTVNNLQSMKVAQRLQFQLVKTGNIVNPPGITRSDWPAEEMCHVFKFTFA